MTQGGQRGRLPAAKWLIVPLLLVVLLAAYNFSVVRARGNSPDDPVLIAAGDVADCSNPGAAETAQLVNSIPGTVAMLGDAAYQSGTVKQFANCYDPTWGQFKARTRPAVGNHEYGSADAAPYFNYFGSAAGKIGEGYYSYDLGSWHIIVLNSNCDEVGGCQPGSPQETWLRADLAAHPARCTLAYWHHPLFGSSGGHANYTNLRAIWEDLYEANTEVILNGHAHNYERMAPEDPHGNIDPQRGIREFIVGTGGRDHRPFSKVIPQSQVHDDKTFGVLKLTLHNGGYDWQFIPQPGTTFTDSGSDSCH